MKIQVVSDVETFSALRAEWNELLSESASDTIFLTWEWLFSWWECYGAKDDLLHIIVIRETTGKLIGILPLYLRVQRWLPLVRMKSLRFIGDGSWDSDYLDSILAADRETELMNCVWDWLRSQRSSWHLLHLSGIPETSPAFKWLRHKAEEKDVVCRSEQVSCLTIELPETWEEYLSSLKPRFRTKVRSTLRELNSHHKVRFQNIKTGIELESGLQILYNLHGKRWESKGSEGVFQNSAKRQFYHRFTRRFLTNGWLAFNLLVLDGQTVACQMCLRYRGTEFLLQEGFDPQFSTESVGVALRAMVIKEAISQGVRRYDFLAGGGRHKTQWQTSSKTCHTIFIGPRTIRNTLFIRVPVVKESLKERVKLALPARALEIRRRLAAS